MTKIVLMAINLLFLSLGGRPLVSGPAAKAVYVCSTHSEVKAEQPGLCPRCNMPLRQEAIATALVMAVNTENPMPHTDHTPRHGGLLGMTEKHHPEYVYKPSGEHRVYLSDEARHPVRLDDVKGNLTLMYPKGATEKLGLAPSPGGTYLAADRKRKVPSGTEVRIDITARGDHIQMDFGIPDAMIYSKPEPISNLALAWNAVAAALSLAGVIGAGFLFRKAQPADGRGTFPYGRLAAVAAMLLLSAGLFAGANQWIIPKMEEAREASIPTPPAPVFHAERAGGETIRLNAQTQAIMGLKVEPAAESELRRNIVALGKVAPRTGAVGEVYAPVAGRATSAGRIPSIGEWVRAGQALVTVEPTLSVPEKTSLTAEEYRVEANIAQAQNTMNQAQLDFQRTERLYELKAIALTELQHATLTYENAKAAYEGALKQRDVYKASQPDSRNSIARYPVSSPIDGVVTLAEVANGEFVSTTKRLFTVMDLSTVWVQAQVYEKDLADVQSTERATLTLDARPGETFTGRIKTISPVLNEATRTADVIFDVPNPQMRLRVGMTARVSMATGRARRSVTVPSSALIEEEGQTAVYIAVNPEQFARREVQVGMSAQGRVEILSGLKPGEPVVVQGGQQVRSAALRAALQGAPSGDGHTGHAH